MHNKFNTSTLAENCHLVWVSTKSCDVLLNPPECQNHVFHSIVGRNKVISRREETERSQTISGQEDILYTIRINQSHIYISQQVFGNYWTVTRTASSANSLLAS